MTVLALINDEVIILGTAVILACIPLQHELLQSLVETKPQPRAFPLAKTVLDALEDRVEAEPGVMLITAGRTSSRLARSDVVLVLGATRELDPIGICYAGGTATSAPVP
jgi:hypothetical protein